MGIELPNPGNIFIPEVPDSVSAQVPELADYLRAVRQALNDGIRDQFSNSLNIATAINSGTSGTFTLSSGGSIVVTSGVVISVTS